MIVKDVANAFHRGGRKAVRELPDRCRHAGHIGVRPVRHQPAEAFLVPGLEFFHFGQVRVQHRYDHKNGIVVVHDLFVRFGEQFLHLLQAEPDAVRYRIFRFWRNDRLFFLGFGILSVRHGSPLRQWRLVRPRTQDRSSSVTGANA